MSKPDFQFHLTDGILVVYLPGSRAEKLQRVPGRMMLIDPAAERVFVNWLSNQEVKLAAETLAVSAGFINHLRRVYELIEPYTGESRTTQWRKGKKNA